MRIGPVEVSRNGIVWGKSGFGRLFEMVRESQIFRGTVSNPYEQVAAVNKAVKAIADNLPQAEIAFYNFKTNEEVDDAELERLFYSPNPEQSSHDFIESMAAYFAYTGEIALQKVTSFGNLAGTTKLPAQLIPLDPECLTEQLSVRKDQILGWHYDSIGYRPEDIILIKTWNPKNRFRGVRPISSIGGYIDLDYKSLQFNRRFFDNDATPGFMLTTDKSLDEKQRDRLRTWQESRHRGYDNAHKIAVFDNGLKPALTARTHQEMEFLEQSRYTREEILGNWRVPKALFNITEDLNYATFNGQMKIFWLYTLMPIMRKIEEGINRHIVTPYNPNIYFAFKVDNVPAFQEDFKDKVTTAKVLFDMGFTADEINQKLNLGFDEEEWRKHWWIGFGQVPADVALDEANNPPDPSTGDGGQDNAPSPKSAGDMVAYKSWQFFITKQKPVEDRLLSKVRRHFYDLRKEVLSNLEKQGGALEALANWGEADNSLKNSVQPAIHKAVEEGVEIAKAQVGKKTALDEMIASKVAAYTSVRANKIVEINRTVKKRIASELQAGIVAGETTLQLSERVKSVFNAASSRAITIARTESAGAVNGGSNLYYREAGIVKKRWITAGDELVRESHREVNGEVVLTADHFSNGLSYPGDQAGQAEDIINCRCTVAPVIR